MHVAENPPFSELETLRSVVRSFTHADEDQCIHTLMEQSGLSQIQRDKIKQRAVDLVNRCRAKIADRSLLDAFLQEFGLSNQEGIALMCMAEALLRIPDAGTADKLIHEKILSGDWQSHLGKSDSIFVNGSTWGLLMTGSIVALDSSITANPLSWLKRLVNRTGEPIIRNAVMQAMRLMGGQYVLGRNIDEAIKRGGKDNPKGTLFSFDMLGEAARTFADAKAYYDAYLKAIQAIGQRYIGGHPYKNNGISVKLSALHPRYAYAHHQQVMDQLLPQLKTLALAAKQNQLGFTLDAEESERLDISLDIFAALARDRLLADWDGLGIVVQAYQKRAPYVIDWLAALARQTGKKFMVRLVKGAYWDREIKFAQQNGLEDFPVYTRKAATDLSFQVCVNRLFDAGDTLYPQFATHNAYTTALILDAAQGRPFEFQRLHGMGGLLYQQLLSEQSLPEQSLPEQLFPGHESLQVRVYAPVGAHQDLLPYLVRRLLENGANSSFVNQFLDHQVAVENLVEDPLSAVLAASVTVDIKDDKAARFRHPLIPKPQDIYSLSSLDGSGRKNSAGLDLNDARVVDTLYAAMHKFSNKVRVAGPIINGEFLSRTDQAELPLLITSPSNRSVTVGSCYSTTAEQVDKAFAVAAEAQTVWDARGGIERAAILERMADLLEEQVAEFICLIVNEAGRTVPDAVDEVREAVDFCRYYAVKARQHFCSAIDLPGPTGETNQLSLHGRGVFLCISPWNFPLAIFVGQVAAALVAGNSVVAKPAEQTPLVAAKAILLFHIAGVPGSVLHMLTGAGPEIGPLLMANAHLGGVAFTGSTATAKRINRQLAEREGAILPLIAETGGQNAMIVDSSALPEQVVDDVISSAFLSAGQRCSALRVLYLQEDIADGIITMLQGAMDALVVGDPNSLSSDIGPVIDNVALNRLSQHLADIGAGKLNKGDVKAKLIKQYELQRLPKSGSFFAPCIIQIDALSQLTGEVFGPVLHIIRYKAEDLAKLMQSINESGYGLTLGVHTRIEQVADYVFQHARVGNTYVNRNTVGAVVGTQPFGGEGLSGTGPKAGGPHYLFRFATEKTKTVNTVATGGNTALFGLC